MMQEALLRISRVCLLTVSADPNAKPEFPSFNHLLMIFKTAMELPRFLIGERDTSHIAGVATFSIQRADH
jgi:hypothetical protein